MTRKDTILIAVIVNTCLLAVLFMTAFVGQSKEETERIELSSVEPSKPVKNESIPVMLPPPPQAVVVLDEEKQTVDITEKKKEDPSTLIAMQTDSEELEVENKLQESASIVEVVVKKGDSLDKIARTYGTSISAIKKLNQLQTVNLSLGQVLKVPSNKEFSSPIQQTPSPSKPQEKRQSNESGAVYYTIKSGDSPWKIAKQNSVSVEEILKLNNLNEEKAKNLKIGDRIRVK